MSRTYTMMTYHSTRAVEFAPGRSNGIPHFAGITREDRAVIMSRRFGGNFSTQGDTEVRYVSLRATESS